MIIDSSATPQLTLSAAAIACLHPGYKHQSGKEDKFLTLLGESWELYFIRDNEYELSSIFHFPDDTHVTIHLNYCIVSGRLVYADLFREGEKEPSLRYVTDLAPKSLQWQVKKILLTTACYDGLASFNLIPNWDTSEFDKSLPKYAARPVDMYHNPPAPDQYQAKDFDSTHEVTLLLDHAPGTGQPTKITYSVTGANKQHVVATLERTIAAYLQDQQTWLITKRVNSLQTLINIVHRANLTDWYLSMPGITLLTTIGTTTNEK